jgi:hypothetical protein
VDALAAELLARAPNPPAPTPHAAVQKHAKDTMAEFAALFAASRLPISRSAKTKAAGPYFATQGIGSAQWSGAGATDLWPTDVPDACVKR